MPKSIVATCKIVTPMFLGGADQEACRIRGAALKGALAFWWRAFHFAGFVADAPGNRDETLEAMREREKVLFGSSDGGQGRFLLRISHGKLSTTAEGVRLQGADMGARYLGYGLMAAFGQNAGQLSRSCINAGQSFAVRIIFRPNATDADIAEITIALKLLGLLGGLGSRVRRGWGSVALERLEGAAEWQGPQSRAEYVAALKALLGDHPGADLPGADWPLTAFAGESSIHVGTQTQASPLDALNDLGEGFLRYRGWRNGDKNFRDDHDWFRQENANPRSSKAPPRRTAFGLPHNYSKQVGVTGPDDLDRRASPLMFHVHQAGSEAFSVATCLPTQFTPNGQVAIERNRVKTPVSYDFPADGLPVIKAFLAGRKPDGSDPEKAYFTTEQVRP